MNTQGYSKILAGIFPSKLILSLFLIPARAAAGEITRVRVASDGKQGISNMDVDLLNTSSSSNIYDSLADAAKLDLTNWSSFEVEQPEYSG